MMKINETLGRWIVAMPSLRRARFVGGEMHRGQLYGDRPYLEHLDDVAGVIVEHRFRFDVVDLLRSVGLAYLHDTIEDVPHADRKLVQAGFHESIIADVIALSRKVGQTPAGYFAQVKEGGPHCRAVKLADRIANVRACLSSQPSPRRLDRYRREQVDLLKLRGDDFLEPMWVCLDKLLTPVSTLVR